MPRSIDLLDFKQNTTRAGRVLAYLVLQRMLADKDRYVPLSEMEMALDFGKLHRPQWSRIRDDIVMLGQLVDTETKSAGPWRLVVDAQVQWHVNKQPATAESISALLNLEQTPVSPDKNVFRRRLKPEACELMTSAERRYRSGAFSKALEAAVELEDLLAADNVELMLACKLRKLRILHRMNDWPALDREIVQLRTMHRSKAWPTGLMPVLECLKELYSAWKGYDQARASAKTHLRTYSVLYARLSQVLPTVQHLPYLRTQVDCEFKNLMILVRRRLLCEFEQAETALVIPSRSKWATEAENWSLESIEQAALNGDLELMGNYCANYAYLLASFSHAGLRTGDSALIDAFRWMTVSDRMATRLRAGADNLWSPIYWLFLRRVSGSRRWDEIGDWIKPIVVRTSGGPVLPNPAQHSSCFDYVAICTQRVLSAHDDYGVASRIPTQQVRMLLEEMCKTRHIEKISQKASAHAYEMVERKWCLAERTLSSADAKRFAAARDCLVRP